MPKRRPRSPKTTTPRSGYWQRFLESQNILGDIADDLIAEEQTTEISSPSNPVSLSQDQYTFTYRVAEALIPIEGYPEHIRKQLLKTREMYRNGLQQVFKEQRDFNEWFIDTRRKAALRDDQLMELLVKSLEGLRSPEARQMRDDFGKVLNQTRLTRAGIR